MVLVLGVAVAVWVVRVPVAPPAPPDMRLDVNDATASELQALPGIGTRRGAAIVAERDDGGAFRGLDDLTRVHGIGPHAVEALGPHAVAE